VQRLMNIIKALDNESRLRILLSLRDGELCLCQIIEFIQLAPSTVSKHVDLLRQAGLIEMRKEGRWHFYALAGRDASPEVREAVRWICRSLQAEEVITADAERIGHLRKITPEELTACYSRS
jgi:ArsR family transcriptional regulator, arsenate/arsenite/antimonite-responsive transcriptional repressor